MSATFASRAERILVWDLPVRVFHWLFAACFAGAWLTAESESWRLVHVVLGYSAAALIVFRLFWGLAGSRYARFAEFVKGPRAAAGYLKSLLVLRPAHFVGHNPAGALVILALLLLGALLTLSGHAYYTDMGGEWLEDVHEALANAMLAVVVVHIAGVIVGSLAHRENLVRAMITGRKRGAAADAIASPRTAWVLVLLAALAGVWWTQWFDAPPGGPVVSRAANHDDDDD
jgi:cytochrome b